MTSIKRTDRFLELAGRVFGWLTNHAKLTLGSLSLLFVVWGGWIVWNNTDHKQTQNLSDTLYGLQNENNENTLKAYEDFIKNNKNAPWFVQIDLFNLYIKNGDLDTALKNIDEIISQSPPDFQKVLSLSKAHLLWQKGFSDQALETLETAVTKYPDSLTISSYAVLLRAEILKSQSRFQEALDLYESLVDDQNPTIQKEARSKILLSLLNKKLDQTVDQGDAP